MKTTLSKFIGSIAGALLLGLLAGCASQDSSHSGHGGQAMACCKCSCKMMQPDPANPAKCKMCGHGQQDHTASTNAPSATKHQH